MAHKKFDSPPGHLQVTLGKCPKCSSIVKVSGEKMTQATQLDMTPDVPTDLRLTAELIHVARLLYEDFSKTLDFKIVGKKLTLAPTDISVITTDDNLARLQRVITRLDSLPKLPY